VELSRDLKYLSRLAKGRLIRLLTYTEVVRVS